MKQGVVLCLIAVTMFAAGAAASVAHAQVTVTVTNKVNATVSAGATVTDAGDCTIQNTSTTDTITIHSVTYTVGTPGLFASTTLTVNTIPQTAAPPSFTNSPPFSVAILPNTTVNCGMSAVISTTPSTTSADRVGKLRPELASAFGPAPGASNRAAGILLLAALGVMAAAGKLRRRHLAVLALAMILTATEAACGNSHNSSIVGASSQKITVMSATSNRGVAVTFTGLPAIMGTLTVQ